MSPNICVDEFYKDLYDVQEVITNTKKVEEHTFILRKRLYKLTEYQVVDSASFNGFIQIEFYDFGGSLQDVYSYLEDDESISDADGIRSILALRLSYNFKIIARYSFKDLRLVINKERKQGKQIKGAFVDEVHNSFGISTYSYKYLLSKYNLLISDNEQTLDGYGLWVNKISMWSRVLVYDMSRNEVICENLDHIAPTVFPWRLPDELSEIEYPLTKHRECKFYTVLFIMQ